MTNMESSPKISERETIWAGLPNKSQVKSLFQMLHSLHLLKTSRYYWTLDMLCTPIILHLSSLGQWALKDSYNRSHLKIGCDMIISLYRSRARMHCWIRANFPTTIKWSELTGNILHNRIGFTVKTYLQHPINKFKHIRKWS